MELIDFKQLISSKGISAWKIWVKKPIFVRIGELYPVAGIRGVSSMVDSRTEFETGIRRKGVEP
jgi:hypothetical protein